MTRLWYCLIRQTNRFPERNSINILFLKSKVGKTTNCCKTSTLNIMMTSASDRPHETVLLKYMDSKMIRKGFQSIEESISASLSPTD